MTNFLRKGNQDQRGVASIVVVSILVVLIGMLSVGFSHFVNRDLSQSVEDQKAQIANYAAESGINATIAYIKAHPGTTSSSCQANQALITFISNGVNSAKYPCVIINNQPNTLTYSNSSPMVSRVIKLSGSTPISSLHFFWTKTPDKFCGNSPPNFFKNGQGLLDEDSWNSGCYAPLMRLTLYSVPASGCNSVHILTSCAGFSSRTMFLYPGDLTNVSGTNIINYSAPGLDGSMQVIQCSGNGNVGGYSSPKPPSRYCNVVLNTLPSSGGTNFTYYARVTPLYNQANYGLEAQDSSGNPINFQSAQTVIDVTATSNDVVKRLQASVDLSGSSAGSAISNIPEYGLASATTLCKRFVNNAGVISVITTNANDCPGGGVPPTQGGAGPPIVVFAPVVGGGGGYSNGDLFEGWVTPNDPTGATFYFEIGTYQPLFKTYSMIYQQPAAPGITLSRGVLQPYVQHVVGAFFDNSTVTFKKNQGYLVSLCAVNSHRPQPYCVKGVYFVYVPPPPNAPKYKGNPNPGGGGGGGGGPPPSPPPPGPPPPPGNCSPSVSVNGDGGVPSESFSASVGNCSSASSFNWNWDDEQSFNGGGGSCESAQGSGSSATVGRYRDASGSISFSVVALDSGGNQLGSGSGSAGIGSAGNYPC